MESFKPDHLKLISTKNIFDQNQAKYFFNREISWLQFNLRVLEEARDFTNPLLERVKFLAIYASNLDEFFMIRVSALKRQLKAGAISPPPDGMNPADQLNQIYHILLSQLSEQAKIWLRELQPQLAASGIKVLNYKKLNRKQKKYFREYFANEIYPTLTPLAFDPSHPFPHISNLSLNLAVVVKDPVNGERFARLKVPDIFPRLLPIPEEVMATAPVYHIPTHQSYSFIWIEEVIIANLELLFPGLEIISAHPFRITRDADLEIEEDEAADLLSSIQESIEMRQFGMSIRMEVNQNMPKKIRDILASNLQLEPYQIFTTHSPMGTSDLMALAKTDRPDLKDRPFTPNIPPMFTAEENIFTTIRQRNVLLYHPYDSFTPVIDFLLQAAKDPNVLAIKQTLYRVGPNSPIVEALLKARENGKQVAVLLELKARFDEENNIGWAQALERAGVHVVYGLVGLKTHAKMCLIVRRENDGITRYVHLSTGNYNAITSRIYTDFSFFSCDPVITADVSDLFNALTGYSRKENYLRLLVAPKNMRVQLIQRIDREIEYHRAHGDGYIAFKMNSLVDKECILALYRASQAGVKIDLQVRGICCLRPGIPGISHNISVTSLLGRFLEHSRIYYFRHGGTHEILLGSADLMPRNLDRRIEVLFPIEDPNLCQMMLKILDIHLSDNLKSRKLLADGHYEKVIRKSGVNPNNSQLWMMEHLGFTTNLGKFTSEPVQPLIAATQEKTFTGGEENS